MKVARPYQLEAIKLGVTRNVLIADEPGLGKTYVGEEIVRLRHQARIPWRGLVIAPLRTIEQWQAEIYEADPNAQVTILKHFMPLEMQHPHTSGKPQGWNLIHYEVVAKQQGLVKYMWDDIICDEAHRLKNRTTKWTQTIKRIQAIRKIALTATPQDKSPADLWSTCNWLYPDVFTSYWMFFDHYVDYEDTFEGRVIKGANLETAEQLASVLARFMLQRTKEQCTPDLPPRIMQRVAVPMGKHQAIHYGTVDNVDDIIVDIDNISLIIPNTLSKIAKLRQITSHPVNLGLESPSAKVDWVMDWITDNPNESVVIFAEFRDTVFEIEKRLSSVGIPSDIVIGGVHETAPRFKAGDVHIVVGTISAMREGIDGLQRANTAIFVDQTWSTIQMTQAIDRIHRMNIDHSKLIYFLRCPDTADDLVLEALDNKWDDIRIAKEYLKKHGYNLRIPETNLHTPRTVAVSSHSEADA